jgi:uncharacterized protein (TIGR02646 family)
MHKLDRTIAAQPACLAGYDHRTQSWDDVRQADKEEIRASLAQVQDTRCAYCEGPIYSGGHIEHFRRKNAQHFPELTFVWSNLFLSCDGGGNEDHCGHYKDRRHAGPYNPSDLVKPDEHNPDHYFYFHSSGEVRPRSGIPVCDAKRASETIRVFNLECGVLKAERRRALRIYQSRNPGMLEALIDFDEQSRQLFIAQEIEATRLDPYWAVIRHFFEKAH